MSKEYSTPSEAQKKLEHYCAYQDRCHDEVIEKLRSLGMDTNATDEIVVYLIAHNFLNEERFAKSFARGKHRIKHWGKMRIVHELKFRNISQYNINSALREITPEEYLDTFNALAEGHWESLQEGNVLRKRKKCYDFLFRKGYESNLITERLDAFRR
ncbi:MAG TPA: regulatory protein RecX [Flavobacterium sp.]|nr:regulatory protein RecX [Flavobacterium sp.]